MKSVICLIFHLISQTDRNWTDKWWICAIIYCSMQFRMWNKLVITGNCYIIFRSEMSSLQHNLSYFLLGNFAVSKVQNYVIVMRTFKILKLWNFIVLTVHCDQTDLFHISDFSLGFEPWELAFCYANNSYMFFVWFLFDDRRQMRSSRHLSISYLLVNWRHSAVRLKFLIIFFHWEW